ncbi:heat domain-containing protein, partial [Nannochloropsis gaditana CCMP526]
MHTLEYRGYIHLLLRRFAILAGVEVLFAPCRRSLDPCCMASPSGPTRDDLDKLLFRLVMAEDSRIEGLIRLHLPMLMDLMSTTSDEGIRNKVVECCSHLLKRLRADNKLQVPCDVLLEKARSPVNGAFTKNFALVFLEIGCPRLPAEAKNALGWALLVGLAAEGTADEAKPFGRHQVALVHCFLETVAFLRPGTGASFTATQASASSMTAPSSGTRSPVREDAGQTPLGSRVSECTLPHPSAQDMAFLRELFLDILLVPNAS